MLPFPFWGFRYSWTFYSFVLFFFSPLFFLLLLFFVFSVLFLFLFCFNFFLLEQLNGSKLSDDLLYCFLHHTACMIFLSAHKEMVFNESVEFVLRKWKCHDCTNHSQLPYTQMQVGLIHTTSTLPLWNKNKNGTRKCTWAIGVHFIVHLSTLCIQLGGWPKPFTQAKNAQLNLVWIYRSMCL